jgi:hypothetical protein
MSGINTRAKAPSAGAPSSEASQFSQAAPLG